VYARVRAIVSVLGASEDEIAEIARRYILSHPAVSTVIPGMRSVRNVERNMAVGDGKGLPEDQVKVLKNYRWDRNIYA
jgi:aryl-alcohol dehydrogenase-like predicted oxidoreductase